MPTYQKYKRVFVPEYKIFSTCAIRQQITREVIQCHMAEIHRAARSLCPYVADIGCHLEFILFLGIGKRVVRLYNTESQKMNHSGYPIYGIWRVPRFLFC